jgi:hypothetical protein
MAMVEPAGSFLGSFPLDSGHRSASNHGWCALSVKKCGKTLPPLIGQQFMLEIRKGMSWRKSLQQKGAGESIKPNQKMFDQSNKKKT